MSTTAWLYTLTGSDFISATDITILNSISVMEDQFAIETTSVSSSQQNQTSQMSPPRDQQLQQATNLIAIDMKLFKEKLDVDCRFEVYKQAFPEMDPANLPEILYRPDNKDDIHIMYSTPCIKYEGLHPPSILPLPRDLDKLRQDSTSESDEETSDGETSDEETSYEKISDKEWKKRNLENCDRCISRSENQIYRMLTSNFCKDKDIRKELLQYYFRFVQFQWTQSRDRIAFCEPSYSQITTLPRFFEAFQPSGLTGQLKHLTLDIPWEYTYSAKTSGNRRDCIRRAPFDDEKAFQKDALSMGRVFGVLHKYKIKTELTFPGTWECRMPFILRVEELCKTHLRRDGPEFWKEHNEQAENIFCHDAELRRLADEFVANEAILTGGRVYAPINLIPSAVAYDIDFSQ